MPTDPLNPFADLTITDEPPQQTSTPFEHPAANIPLPDEQPVQPAPTSQKQAVSVAGSYRGMTPQGLATTQRLGGRAGRLAQADINRFAPQYEEQEKDAEAIAAQRREGLRLETEAHAEHARREAELFKAQQHFATERAELEKMASAHSQIVRQQYLANYEQELAGVRELAMRSGDPNETMSGGEAFGLIAAHAVQGFLKVGHGINIDVAGQTERWMNREIAKHQQRIQDAREGANDQLHLYNLARQTAADEWEARERYHGFLLEGMKSQLMAEASRFNSQVATATAAQKAAEIDTQLLGVKSHLADRQQQLYFNAQQMRITQAHQQAQDSVASMHAKADLMRADTEAKKNTSKPNGVLGIPDPGATTRDENGKIVSQKVVWALNPNATDAQKNAAMELVTKEGGAYASIAQHLHELRRLRDRAFNDISEKYGSVAKGLLSPEYREYKRQKDLIGEATIKAFTGAQAPDAQMKRLLGILADDSGWITGGNASGIEQLEKYFRDEYVTKLNQNPAVVTLPKDQQYEKPYGDSSNDTDAGYETGLFGKGGGVGAVQDALQEVNKVGHNEVTQSMPSPLYAGYAGKGGVPVEGQSAEMVGVDRLAAIVAKPEIFAGENTVNGQPTQDPNDLRSGALVALQGLAGGSKQSNGRAADPEVQKYAAFVLEQIKKATSADELYRVVSEDAMGSTEDATSSGHWLDDEDTYQRMNDFVTGKHARETEPAWVTQDRADYLRKGITGQ